MNTDTEHPGTYVRKHVIPSEINVTTAARLLEVSRPALSNFLNGKADLSPEMAARLEAAFGVAARRLLDLQSAWDAARSNNVNLAAIIKSYVPPFLQIKATQIEAWADSGIAPRQRLSVFLRTLVNSTGANLSKVDFPGNDDSERPGWDGEIIANQATPWIPEGHSGWEFGVNANVKRKADHDFGKSVAAIADATARKKVTFVFATPRNWPGKASWLKEQKAKKLWKDVRAYDASDLEQWLEQSLSGQAWFASETGQHASGAVSLDEAWKNWAADCEPTLTPSLFADAIRVGTPILRRGLAETPSRPIIVTADSRDEALAFISAAFATESDELGTYRDRIIVFREPGALSKLASKVSNFIPVILSREVEKEFAPFRTSMPSLIIYPRNATVERPDIELETVSWETFDNALRAMELDQDRIDQLNRESGRSPTVLRRRLSKLPAIRTPDWASDKDLAAILIPFVFAGAWKGENNADKVMLEVLAGDVPYADLERRLIGLLPLDGSPVWSVGALRGVVSKIDVLFAIRDVITAADLERFFDVAGLVLSEENPALELPEKDRWAAGIYGKTREISGALRDGLAESLILLSVYGPSLFKARLNVDTSTMAADLVRSLLTPLSSKTLESQTDNLSLYAEAAPETFLSLMEADLLSADSASLALMRPIGDAMFGGSPRTGLLWALEGLGWSERLFMRTVLVLGRLAERSIDDNLVNKPSNSLSSIFRSWMPQTSASLDARKAALDKLVEKHPDVAWQICLEQFSPLSRVGHHSHKPRWRPDGHGLGNPVSDNDRIDFALHAFRLALGWKSPTVQMVGGLLNNLTGLGEEEQLAVWDVVDKWSNTATAEDRAILREKIRVTTMTRRAMLHRGDLVTQDTQARAKAAFDRLMPEDPVLRHTWLFKTAWVDESVEEIADDSLDYRSREDRIARLREQAVRDVLSTGGIPALIKLGESGEASYNVGWSLGKVTDDDVALTDALVEIADSGELTGSRLNLVSGILTQSGIDHRAVLRSAVQRLSVDKVVPLLTAAPFDRATWTEVNTLGGDIAKRYWKDVPPNWNRDGEDLITGVSNLMKADRPRAAFRFAHFDVKELPARILFDMLAAIASSSNEAANTYMLDRHDLREAFSTLDASGEINIEAMAGLEFHFIEIFSDDEGRPKNLEVQICRDPSLFIHAIACAFKRDDDNDDPSEFLIEDEEQRARRAQAMYKVLDVVARTPGQNEDGTIDTHSLVAWIEQVQTGCAAVARRGVGDQMIGRLLSHAPSDQDGTWPCAPVRDALEHILNDEVERGLAIAVFNSRGVHSRGPDGSQERVLAAKYGGWASAIEYSHPRVATMLHGIESSYLRDAEWQDGNGKASRRLGR
jgi:addiction module HigA family antidote